MMLSSQGIFDKSRAGQSRQGHLSSYLGNHDNAIIRSVRCSTHINIRKGYFPKLSISESRRMITTCLSSSPNDENSTDRDNKKKTLVQEIAFILTITERRRSTHESW